MKKQNSDELEWDRDINDDGNNQEKEKLKNELRPSTLGHYARGLQRAFKIYWGYGLNILSGPIFGHPDTGLKTFIDNKCKDLQEKGLYPQGHNVLSDADVLKLYTSSELTMDHPRGLITRLILDLAYVTTWRPGMISSLRMDQIRKVTANGEPAYRIFSLIASERGSKTAQGVLRAASDKPLEVTIWRRQQLNGQLCVFDDIERYLTATAKFRNEKDELLLSVNYGFTPGDLQTFYKNCNLGAGTVSKYVTGSCDKLGICGDGVRDSFTMHGIRATSITNLFDDGYERETVATKTGHKNPKSLTRYQSNRGRLGEGMQMAMFGAGQLEKEDEKGFPKGEDIGNNVINDQQQQEMQGGNVNVLRDDDHVSAAERRKRFKPDGPIHLAAVPLSSLNGRTSWTIGYLTYQLSMEVWL